VADPRRNAKKLETGQNASLERAMRAVMKFTTLIALAMLAVGGYRPDLPH
jgi:hypothetical protein